VKRSLVRVSAATFFCVVFAGAAGAVPPPPKDWEVQLKLYAWSPWLQMKVKTEDVETTANLSFFDILEDLSWGAMGGVEGRYKRGLMMVDFIGMQIALDSDSDPRNVPFTLPGGRDGNLRIGGTDSTTRPTIWMVDNKLGFRALSLPFTKLTGSPDDPGDSRRLDFDLLAGYRYWNVDTSVRVGVEPAQLTVGGAPAALPGLLPDEVLGKTKLPGRLLSGGRHWVHDQVDWFDPIVGFRLGANVTPKLWLFALGDIGGWNAFSESSDLTWQGQVGARWNFSEHWSAEASYRAIGVNRDTALVNTILYGPQFGVVFRF
jgi:hypothetical protein